MNCDHLVRIFDVDKSFLLIALQSLRRKPVSDQCVFAMIFHTPPEPLR